MNYLNRFLGVSLGLAATALVPTTALAQAVPSVDQTFLDELYTAIEEYDDLAYNFALEMGDDNIELASMVCAMFDEGSAAIDGFGTIFSGVNSGFYDAGAEDIFTADQIDNASLVYSVALVSFGTDFYCPQYTPAVIAALEELDS
ncbi:MAG: hypothetical protein AAFR42_04600 [Cyanobacteria bacterium J06628_6]